MKLLLIVVVGIGVRVGLGMKAFLQFRAPTNMTVVTGPASPTVHRTLPDRAGSARRPTSAPPDIRRAARSLERRG